MKVYLKWYYGYQNLWDEILLFGVIQYLYDQMNVTHIILEVQDEKRMKSWMAKHLHFLPNITLTYQSLSLPNQKLTYRWQKILLGLRWLFGLMPLIVFGGGEIINTLRPFDTWNYLLQYPLHILTGRYILIGGVTHRWKDDRIAKILIKNAQKVIVRDAWSSCNVKVFRNDVTLFQDFAIDIILHSLEETKTWHEEKEGTVLPWSIPHEPYILLNLHPSCLDDKSMKKIHSFIQKYKKHQIYFIPCDMIHDMQCYEVLKEKYKDIQLFDWTHYDIDSIVKFFVWCTAGLGARLHFLLLLQQCKRPFEAIVYHDKVRKVLQL